MSAEQLVKNCAPILAGIKTGSLYNLGTDTRQDAYPDICFQTSGSEERSELSDSKRNAR